MAKNRLTGEYPAIGIRPTIDARRGPLRVRENLEEQTMNMAKSAKKPKTRLTKKIANKSQASYNRFSVRGFAVCQEESYIATPI